MEAITRLMGEDARIPEQEDERRRNCGMHFPDQARSAFEWRMQVFLFYNNIARDVLHLIKI